MPRHEMNGKQFIALLIGISVVFGFWGVMTAKRLLAVCWPRTLALMVLAPSVWWVLEGWSAVQHRTAYALFPVGVLLLGAGSMGYLVLTVALVFLPSQAHETPRG